MKELLGSVSPMGQVTIPIEIRRMLGVTPRDKVAFKVEGREVRLVPASASIREFYQAVPALGPPRSLEEMTTIAAEEHAREVAEAGEHRMPRTACVSAEMHAGGGDRDAHLIHRAGRRGRHSEKGACPWVEGWRMLRVRLDRLPSRGRRWDGQAGTATRVGGGRQA